MEGRYQSRSYLTIRNDALILPDYFVLDGSVRFAIDGQALVCGARTSAIRRIQQRLR